MTSAFSFSRNQSVIVTGASRGIGAETAKLFAKHGYAVCINYLSQHTRATDLANTINSNGGLAIAIQGDMSDEADVKALFSAVSAQLPPLSVLVNNVGVLTTQSRLSDMSLSRFSQVLNTNVLSCFLCAREAIPYLSISEQGQGGAIVNVSSLASVTGAPNEYIDYAASKGAMDSITRGLAKELAKQKIRVNGVRPGLIYTDIHASGGDPDRVERLAANLPLGRGGHAKEVAEAIYWLGSDQSSFTTGSFIDVAGGLTG